jgi:glycosyltransferase involved in cell wall biosynthesis
MCELVEKNKMLLSILICGLPTRQDHFFYLYDKLSKQIIEQDDCVELLYCLDSSEKKGGLTTGAKRNRLLDAASGDFLCFIDDDDDVPDNYVKLICEALKTNPTVDCLGIVGIMRGPTGVEATFKHSIQYKTWHSDGHKVYYRCPNHLNPVRSALAKAVRFSEITIGEDADFSLRLLPKLSSEFNVEQPLYLYLTRYRFDPPPPSPRRISGYKIRRTPR